MKTLAALTLALSSLAAATAAQAQERQVTVYSGPVGIELPAAMLRGTVPATAANADTSNTRKVRIIMASPYGN